MRDTDYAYAVARIRVNELKLLTHADIELLLSQKTCEDCVRRLLDKGYGGAGAERADEMQLMRLEQQRAWALIDEIAPYPAVFDRLKMGNDFHNLKAVMKTIISNSASYQPLVMSPYITEPSLFESAVKEKNFDILPEHLRQCARQAYTAFVEVRDGQLGEAIIDRASIEQENALPDRSSKMLVDYSALRADTTNIKIAWRCALTKKSLSFIETCLALCGSLDARELAAAAAQGTEQLLELLEHSDYSDAVPVLGEGMSAFEKWCDARILRLIAPAKYKPFGPEPLAAYLLAKELEIKTVRIILSGKRNGVDDERLRTRVRQLY